MAEFELQPAKSSMRKAVPQVTARSATTIEIRTAQDSAERPTMSKAAYSGGSLFSVSVGGLRPTRLSST